MKKNSIAIFSAVIFILGLFIGIQMKEPYQMSEYGSLYTRTLISGINRERLILHEGQKEKNTLQRELEKINHQASYENEDIATYNQEINQYKKILGYATVQGPGIVITIDGYEDYNLAFLMEEKSFLLQIINELKQNEAEAISINSLRIGPLSEITLAGSHLHINQQAIAQPYQIKVIGESGQLMSYMDAKSPIIDIMRRGYGLQVTVEEQPSVEIQGMTKRRSLEYITMEK